MGFSKLRDCSIYVPKTKVLISFAVTSKICGYLEADLHLFLHMQKAGFLLMQLISKKLHVSKKLYFCFSCVSDFLVSVVKEG